MGRNGSKPRVLPRSVSAMDVSRSEEGSVSKTFSFYQSVSTVLSMFNSISRPDAMTWYARTRFYHIVDLTVSLLNPTEQAAKKVHPLYRLTHVQSTNKYPSIVDWIPFPSIRDKLILLHSGNPNVDDIFCDAVSGYVVQTNMSELVEGASVLPVHVRVLDLIKAMDEKSKASDVGKLPASNARAIFNSPATARLVFQKLRMDHGVSQYMMDPAFFQKYPELYDPAANIMAHGVALRPQKQAVLSRPKSLDSVTLKAYRDFTDFSSDLIWKSYQDTLLNGWVPDMSGMGALDDCQVVL